MADDNNEKTDESRRRFIKNTGWVAGGVVGGSLFGGLLTSQLQDEPDTQTKEKETTQTLQEARTFFSRKEDFETLSAATERILPEDDDGPGAIELGVPFFIDKQLSGSWGTNDKAYMKDPFFQDNQTYEYQHKDTKQHKSGPNTSSQAPSSVPRYQTRMNRGEIYIRGLRRMNEVSQNKFDKKFFDLETDQKDEVLKAFDNGEIMMRGAAGVTFFNLLRQMTLEGAFSDPVYGGNKNMAGWKMKEFPGPRLGYTQEIESEEFIKKEPKSLRDYQS
ncbi:gluconate 2-dehydrogenase subunit 3 family protein [Lentibacillus halophilus]|uniref:Gluconate 2-dehydrogenase subunit 3 family protein n=1 Tax=Lentibacillus halophilus TaxID=295065 RepID=A0ABP3J3I7_9BACI